MDDSQVDDSPTDGRPVELLILDFAGVCTPSASAYLASGERATGSMVAHPGCEELIRRAQRAGVTVMILSNEISADWEASLPLLSVVDRVIACSDNNIYKPDRRAFLRCVLLSDATAERTLVVDDEPDNITVAESLGMQTVLFDETDLEAGWTAVAKHLPTAD